MSFLMRLSETAFFRFVWSFVGKSAILGITCPRFDCWGDVVAGWKMAYPKKTLLIAWSMALLCLYALIGPFASAAKLSLSQTDTHLQSMTLDLNGTPRSYLLYTPANYDSARKTPLVFAFHGFKEDPALMIDMTRFNEVADKEGFLIAYPAVLKDRWNAKTAPSDSGEMDLQFVDAMIRRIVLDRNVDTQRIYATGFSDGGFFTQRLACEMADRFAAFAPVAATIGIPLRETCQPSRPIPMMIMNGTDDPIITWKGKIRRVRYAFRDSHITTVPQAVTFWQRKNRCTPQVTAKLQLHAFADGAGVQMNSYEPCALPGALQQVIVYKGGHTWPNTVATNTVRFGEFLVGNQNHDINASQVIWDFFKGFTLPEKDTSATAPTQSPE
jgi:polyhydroxybutyrate depolymerase